MTQPIAAAAVCAALPGAEASFPFGPDHQVWKVGAKIFAVLSTKGTTVKCPDVETASLIIEAGRAEKAPYFHASWVQIPPDRVDPPEIAERLERSYGLIRASLSKKLQATLGPWVTRP
jgi:predicted DNA-binding protein (MmcQ/YjbR family)